jgi:peptidoglycan/LPS O-acetylase OafA/YrhL
MDVANREVAIERTGQFDYRPDIDGLRAIAVMAVVGFHTFPDKIKGGFVGVDMFFVISGFLISGIIFRGIVRGTFSYRDFYERRVRRIFPALIVVLLCSLLYGYYALFSTEFTRMANHIAAAALFGANILFWHEAGYFDTNAAFKPMLHLWSLGVEEQYYILWPLIVSGFMLKMRRFYFVIITIFVVSLSANLALTWREPSAAFFLPIARFWELMLGSGLAYFATAGRASFGPGLVGRKVARWDGPVVRDVLSFVGLGMVAASVLLIDSEYPFPGFLALGPTVGTALLIQVGRGAWINRHLLSLPPVIVFGLISYPLYLWHWPILAFLHIDLGANLSRSIRIGAILTSVLLAWITYHFVEKPVRFGVHRSTKVTGLVGAIASIGIFAFVGGHLFRLGDSRDAYAAFFANKPPDYHYGHTHNLFDLGREECNFLDITTNLPRVKIADKCTTPETGLSVLAWGDSHIQHLASGLRATIPDSVSLLQVATSGCRPSLDENSSNQTLACVRSNRFARATIASLRPEVVILAQRSEHLETDWNVFAAKLRSLGARSVILVGPVPQWNRDLHLIIARRHWPNPPEWIHEGLLERPKLEDNELKRRHGKSPELVYVSIVDQMCRPDGCRAFIGPDKNEDIVTHDYGHFTSSASRYVAERSLTPAVNNLIAKAP